MTCHGSFPSCCEENDSDPKSGRDLDQHFHMLFVVFVPDSTIFATNPRIIELVVGSAPMEHPYNISLSFHLK